MAVEWTISMSDANAEKVIEAFGKEGAPIENRLVRALKKAAAQELLDQHVRRAQEAHEEAMRAKAAELSAEFGLSEIP